MLLSIIIPVFNEERTLQDVLRRVKKIKLPSKIRKEIIIINDGSTDQTTLILEKIHHNQIKIVHHKKNLGKGAAIRTGLKFASGELLVIQDADLEYNPKDLERLIKVILEKNVFVVYGTRLKNYPLKLWGKNKTVMPSHWVGNKFLTLLTNLIYKAKLTDMETCYKLFKKEALDNISIKSNRFDFEPEITAKVLKGGYDILEIPIKVVPRTSKEGKKIKWQDGFGAIWALLKYRFVD